MGIRGLTTYIDRHSKQCFEKYALHDTFLVIDGNNLTMQMYRWHCNCYDCFGGDYDKYALKVHQFFNLLKESNVTPLIIFDGGFENRKLKTIFQRMRDRIKSANKLNSATEGSITVFPLLIRQLFQDIVKNLGLRSVRCDFEADHEMVCIARALNCPVLSYDSDFYVSNVKYIPFSSLEMRTIVVRDESRVKKAIPCQMYNVDEFLRLSGGLDKSMLPLLGILLGNDYIEVRTFSRFYKHIKLAKKKHMQSHQQRRIHAVVKWLQNETYDSAVVKILGRSKEKFRIFISKQMEIAKSSYIAVESKLLFYLDIDVQNTKSDDLEKKEHVHQSISSIENLPPGEESSDDEDVDIEIKIDTDFDLEMDEISLCNQLPEWFLDKYRKSIYPAAFMDMVLKNIHFATPQHEDYSTPHSDNISYGILSAIHTILTSGKSNELIFVARGKDCQTKKYQIPKSTKNLPLLEELHTLEKNKARDIILHVLDVDDNFLKLLEHYPKTWHLFLICLNFWCKNGTNVRHAHVFAVLLCAIVLNVFDRRIGFHRSIKSFMSYYEKNIDSAKSYTDNNPTNLSHKLDSISEKESLLCMKQLIINFHMDKKLLQNPKNFNIQIIDVLAQLQSCCYYITFLNVLLGEPFNGFTISDFYNGTFIYNICANFLKRADINPYIKQSYSHSPMFLESYMFITSTFMCTLTLEKTNVTKVRRKRKTKKNFEDIKEDLVICSDDGIDEHFVDVNNRFSALNLG